MSIQPRAIRCALLGSGRQNSFEHHRGYASTPALVNMVVALDSASWPRANPIAASPSAESLPAVKKKCLWRIFTGAAGCLSGSSVPAKLKRRSWTGRSPSLTELKMPHEIRAVQESLDETNGHTPES
jgi:hypothetical protein